MRLFGHPLHVMLVHFPVALWPAHWVFHVLSGVLPPGVATVAGFWLLIGAGGTGWIALVAGAADLIALSRDDGVRFKTGLVHAIINGTVLLAFSALAVWEYSLYPNVHYGTGLLVAEALMLAALFVGNYFGGTLVWSGQPQRQERESAG
jgi:uncharacterized membrane protein